MLLDVKIIGMEGSDDEIYSIAALDHPPYVRKCHPIGLSCFGRGTLEQLTHYLERWNN